MAVSGGAFWLGRCRCDPDGCGGIDGIETTGAFANAPDTRVTHVAHLLAKLQVENRAQAIVQALKRGILSVEELD